MPYLPTKVKRNKYERLSKCKIKIMANRHLQFLELERLLMQHYTIAYQKPKQGNCEKVDRRAGLLEVLRLKSSAS